MDKEKDVDIISQVKKCLSDSGGGYTDLDAVNKIDRLLYKLSAESQSQSYVSEKIASIKSFARILSSDRKHTKYPGGVEEIRGFILQDCSSLKNYLLRLHNK